MKEDLTTDDEVIEVKLPRKDYKVMRDIIAERQAMNGLSKLLNRFFWIIGGLLSIFGLVELLRRFG